MGDPETAPAARVDRAALEARLAQVRAVAGDPVAGVFGPATMLWEVNREAAVFLGAGRAALLQLAHPWVAVAVDQHSTTRTDPLGRFRRTFYHVFSMVYGDLATAERAARAVWGIHERITGSLPEDVGAWRAGTPYRANDPRALFWVHATLFDSAVVCFEQLVRPLADAEKDRYYEESKRFAWLFGVPDAVIPPDWKTFRGYVEDMLASDRLAVAPCAREMCAFLFRPPVPGTAALLARYARLTASLLPPRLAAGFGLPEARSPAARRGVERDLARLRRWYPHLPRRLRYLPAYLEAERRIAGDTRRDRLGEWLTRLLVGRPPLYR